MRLKIPFVMILLAGWMGGCAASSQQMTAKQESLHRWSMARAAVLLTMANSQYTDGNFDRCRQTLNEALQMDPNNASIHLLSAQVAIEQGQLDVAQQELATAGKLSPKLGKVDYLDGVIYQRWQQPQKALSYYQIAYEKDPTALPYLMAKAEMLVNLGHPDEALNLLEAKVDYFEHSAAIRDAVGLLLRDQHRLSEAIEMFRRASLLSPDDPTLREHLAMALFQDGQEAEAGDILNELITNNPAMAKRADLLMALAECQLDTGQPAAARDSAQSACNLTPSLAAPWLTLAKADLRLHDLPGAEMGLDKAMGLAPNDSDSYLLMGYLRLQQSQLPQALSCFDQSHQLNPKDSTSLCMMGFTLQKMGRKQEAARFYAQALKVDPADSLASDLIAGLHAR
jgi:tetratricopeptide (TPR) repeat protein